MSIISNDWCILPKEASGNRNAIFFAISDNYSFAVASIIMSLSRHSEKMMRGTDIIIYHNGISDKNKELLQSLHGSMFFIPMHFPGEWAEILEHPKTTRWGEYVICKLFGFELIKRYERVLHLDADMHVLGDISDLFLIEQELAWRTIIGWSIKDIFSDILASDTQIKSGNGGMLLFTDKLLKYGIDKYDIRDTFYEIKDLRDGGTDETIIALLVHKKGIVLKEVDIRLYNTPLIYVNDETRLVHFLGTKHVSAKPWKNPVTLLYFDDWYRNYQRWLGMGGEGLVRFSREDYYRMYGFDKAEEAAGLNERLTALVCEKQELEEKLSGLEEKINGLEKANDGLTSEIKSKDERLSHLSGQLKAVTESRLWKITEPLRRLRKRGAGK